MKKTITLLLILFLSSTAFAQDIDIPENITLEKAEDYKRTEGLVLKSIDWIQNTPISKQGSKRKEVNSFIFTWMSGSPTVSISLVDGIVPLDCADCLMAFMSGWTKYSLLNDYSKNNVAGAMAGAKQAIDLYKRNRATIGKNAGMEKLLKLAKKGKLKSFIKSKY